MNKNDRMRAWSMRCDGMTWTQIGAVLGYDSTTVYKDLQRVLEKAPRGKRILYPAIEAYIDVNHNGSVELFANSLGIPPHRIRRVLVNGDIPSTRVREKIVTAVGLPDKEVFST